MSAKSDVFQFWLKRGFSILPCKKNSKSLVYGFGEYQKKLTILEDVERWSAENPHGNIAALAPREFYILDFDDAGLYAEWEKSFSESPKTYTEETPRGGKHVFFKGLVPAGVRLVGGVELKRSVLVNPSVVDGKPYKRLNCFEILEADPACVLRPLSVPGAASAHFLRSDEIRRSAQKNSLSKVEQIKTHFSISHVLKIYKPEIVFIGRGDWKSCRCPFHKDNKPSFYFSDAVGVWGCHACGVRGDAINLYARFEAVNVREAIERMWAVMA